MISWKPQIVAPIAQSAISKLSSFVRLIDFALDWVHMEAGQVLYRQGTQQFCEIPFHRMSVFAGEEPTCMFVVLAGRIRGVVSRGSASDTMRDFCRGDMIGQ